MVLTVRGEVDLATAPQLHAKLTDLVENAAGSVVVDLTPVTFMDATGLRVLLAGRQRARTRGRSVQLVCPEGPVLRVLRLTGVDKAFPLYTLPISTASTCRRGQACALLAMSASRAI